MFKLNFPYAHFASRGATGDMLFPLVWEAIRRLESSEIKVLCVTADGASPNRKFLECIMILMTPHHYTKQKTIMLLMDDQSILWQTHPI